MKTKAQEIEVIKELVEMDGYFADYFKADLDTMVQNITNDYPIEMGARFNESQEKQTERMKEIEKRHREEIVSFCDTMLIAHADTGNQMLYDHVEETIGTIEIVRRKRALGVSVSAEEIDYLIANVLK